MAPRTDIVVARDGTELFTRTWPASGEPWGVVLVVHGVSEHSGRYEQVGKWLSGAGLEVHAYDHRGFGRSGGRRAYVRSWEALLTDLEDRLAAVRAPGLPLTLWGHSMGGLLATEYAESDAPQPDLLVLSSPGLGSSHPRWLRLLAEVSGRVIPRLFVPDRGSDYSHLSRDPAVSEAFANDPLVVHGATARLGLEAFRAQRRASAAIDRIRVPTLVIHGGADLLCPPSASEPLERLAVVERRLYPGLRHELHQEPEGREIVEEAVAWLRAEAERLADAATPSSAAATPPGAPR